MRSPDLFQAPHGYLNAGSSATLQGLQKNLNLPTGTIRDSTEFSSILKDCCKSRAKAEGAEAQVVCELLLCNLATAVVIPVDLELSAVFFLLCVPHLPGDERNTPGVCFAEPPNAALIVAQFELCLKCIKCYKIVRVPRALVFQIGHLE